MISKDCEHAISDVLRYGKALFKFITPNNVGMTGSHECGYYLPINARYLYTPHEPEDGVNREHFVKIKWQDEKITDSCVKWYGRGTRHEYRLTRFGRDFPWLSQDNIGDLLVLIFKNTNEFLGYVFKSDEDIEEIIAALGIEIVDNWSLYDNEIEPEEHDEETCIGGRFRYFTESLNDFPTGNEISRKTWETLLECSTEFRDYNPDRKLLILHEEEYKLFKNIERSLCNEQISRLFKDIDDFLNAAASIMNRRKARAGRALENQVEFLLNERGIPHVMRPSVNGTPDVLIPSKEAYEDKTFPVGKLFVLALKRTCKDRWRQVLQEAKRLDHKYILTIQQGISENQLKEMKGSNVTLVVPEKLHKDYPENNEILSVEEFFKIVEKTLAI